MNRSVPVVHQDPRYEALAREAAAAMQAGDDTGAERAASALVRINPREHAAWHALAVVALRACRREAAVELAERAHQLDRKNPGYLNTLGIAYGDLARADKAIAAFRRALKLRPAFADAHYNLAMVYDRHERLEEARDAYRRTLAIEPGHSSATHNLARVLRRLGDAEAALGMAREAYAQAPDNVDRAVALASALTDARGDTEARQFIEQCIASHPREPRYHSWLAESLLKHGEWLAGWGEYLWRAAAMRRRELPLNALPDGPDAAMRLVPDQGLGDTLFFLRFASALIERGATAALEAPPQLAAVLAGRRDLAKLSVVTNADGASRGATSVLMGDLPYLLGAEDIAPAVRLTARHELVQHWREVLAGLGPPPHVGLTWRGGTDRRSESKFGERGDDPLFKQVPLRALGSAVSELTATLVSIQRLPRPDEREELSGLAGRVVHDLSMANDDLEQVTALLAALDDYAGVSNTNMHLRAGLGLTARVLVPYPPEFRWMAAGAESPWFPGFGVYRQRADRDWNEAVAQLSGDLRSRWQT